MAIDRWSEGLLLPIEGVEDLLSGVVDRLQDGVIVKVPMAAVGSILRFLQFGGGGEEDALPPLGVLIGEAYHEAGLSAASDDGDASLRFSDMVDDGGEQ